MAAVTAVALAGWYMDVSMAFVYLDELLAEEDESWLIHHQLTSWVLLIRLGLFKHANGYKTLLIYN